MAIDSSILAWEIPWILATSLLSPWNSPGKNTEVGCHFLLQGIFLIQGSNLSLPYCTQIHYHMAKHFLKPVDGGEFQGI